MKVARSVYKTLRSLDKWLLLVSVILFVWGLIMIFSASNIAAFMRYYGSPYRFLEKQLWVLGFSLVLFLVIVLFSTKFYNIVSWPLLVLIIGLLIAVLFYGKIINERQSWFPIGDFHFQPSEFAKVIMIAWMASFYELNRMSLNKKFTIWFPLIICGAVFMLIAKEPDLGTALIFASIVLFVFILIPIKLLLKVKTFFILGVMVLLIGLYTMATGGELLQNRQSSRLDYDNPCHEDNFYNKGNQLCNAYIAMNNGGLWGRGLGNSTQKYLYLPEAHTDFIFAIIVEELGLVRASLVIVLYTILLLRIIIIGKRSISARGSILCYGIAMYIFLHIVVNLAGIMGITPMSGIPLPFMSYAGSFTIALVASLAIVQRVCVETKLKEF